MAKDKTILYVGLGLAALLALRYFSKKRTQAGGTVTAPDGLPSKEMTEEQKNILADFNSKIQTF